ncbi:hypothetical protein [Streptomyces sp. NPDC127098]|uniref:hypothetical protein n=1 Tax=Streptomyces sp. NPDC127098 TaxID=3347137 RepID=UPI0036519200
MSELWGRGGGYQAWADHLEQWARGARPDPDRLPALARDDFTAGTWARLANRLTEAISTSLQTWADGLTAAMSAETDEFAVGRALAQAREGLRGVRALAAHPGLPAELRERLLRLVDGQVARLQEELERDLARRPETATEPRWVEARLRTLRDNPLTAVLAEDTDRPSAAAGWTYDPAAPTRRRVIRP